MIIPGIASIVTTFALQAGQADLLKRVEEVLARNEAAFVALRHDLHRNPETSGNEVRTSRIVAERMRALGLEVRTNVGGHGVVAILRGGRPGPLVAYRADMDAVRSSDPDPVEYRSLIPNVRHICGHDVHTSIAVALATALAAVRSDLPGSVMFIFQPAEENATGARAMLADSLFARQRPVAIFGVHTAPYEVGVLGTRPGVMMAFRDFVSVSIAGRDNLTVAADSMRVFLAALSTIKPEQQLQEAPADFLLVQVNPAGMVNGRMVVSAMISLASDSARQRVMQQIARQVFSLRIEGVTLTHEYRRDAVAGVRNSGSLTETSVSALRRALGDSSVRAVNSVLPAFSEDFGSYQALMPGTFFFLGVSNSAKKWVGMPHSPGYVADDRAIGFGARAMAAVILQRMGGLTE
jgi:amidohydrolase